jgi:hypothetical protein
VDHSKLVLRREQRERSEFWRTTSEVFIFEVGRENQLDEGIAEKELILAIVKAEAHFVHMDGSPFPTTAMAIAVASGFKII